jgi:hypothetical protein
MWKALYPGDRVTLGDTIRYRPTAANMAYKDKVYLVVKTELHYFEIIEKLAEETAEDTFARKIIKYMDIGYHLGLEVWSEPVKD